MYNRHCVFKKWSWDQLTMGECWQMQRQLDLCKCVHLVELSACSVVTGVTVLGAKMVTLVDIFTRFGFLKKEGKYIYQDKAGTKTLRFQPDTLQEPIK